MGVEHTAKPMKARLHHSGQGHLESKRKNQKKKEEEEKKGNVVLLSPNYSWARPKEQQFEYCLLEEDTGTNKSILLSPLVKG